MTLHPALSIILSKEPINATGLPRTIKVFPLHRHHSLNGVFSKTERPINSIYERLSPKGIGQSITRAVYNITRRVKHPSFPNRDCSRRPHSEALRN